MARGREAAAAMAERLTRASAYRIAHPRLVVIDNSGPLAEAGERLTALRIAAAAGTPQA